MDKISVIVPIYKVEKYLERCVRSICCQTYQNLEIILVDDGSPDRCGQMCDEFAEVDSRIRVIHKVNGGLSDARNTGMDMATGDYIAFIDSDDWYDPTMLEILHSLSRKYHADIAECDYRNYYADQITYCSQSTGKIIEATPLQALEAELDYSFCKPTAWNKLYRTEITKGIRYAVGKLHEDEYTTHKFYLAANKIVSVDLALYNYERRNLGSITGSFKAKNLDVFYAFRERMHLVWSRPDLTPLEKKMDNLYSWILFDLMDKCEQFGVTGPERDQVIQTALHDYPEVLEHGVDDWYIEKYQNLKKTYQKERVL